MYQYLSQSLMAAPAALATQNISGNLSGTYTKKRYFVTADCVVPTGVQVAFDPGSVIEFDGDFKIDVIGRIQLNGTSGERITIKASAANVNNRWRGFRLCTTSGDSFSSGDNNQDHKFTYCDFYNAEKLQETTGNYHRTRGAAIFSYLNELLTITNCTFTSCKGYDYGGTCYIHMETANTLVFNNCTFTNCSCQNDSSAAWVLVHGTFSVSGMSYSGNTMGWTDGNNFGFTVNTATDTLTSTSGDTFSYTGQEVFFAANANAPAPCTAGTYYMIRVDATNWKLATTLANANAGTAIDLTAQPTGTKVCKLQVNYSWFDGTVTVNA